MEVLSKVKAAQWNTIEFYMGFEKPWSVNRNCGSLFLLKFVHFTNESKSVVFFRLVAANISVFLHSSNKGTASGIHFIIHLFPENC